MKHKLLIILGTILILAGSSIPLYNKYAEYRFNIDVTQRLKRAADANTVDIASKEMASVIAYLESHNMTRGNTSLLLAKPANDVEFWYENLKASLNELKHIEATAGRVEKTNTLMKLRETLLDNDSVTQPDLIYLYPYVRTMYCLGGMSFLIILSGVVVIIYSFITKV
jgi:hypothetical protein